MVESLKELDRICQKPNHKTVGNWMVRQILRPAALPITWLLLHTPVTANQVTLAALFTGLLGILLLAALPSKVFLLAVALLQIWYLLDHVDGQIARYRKTASLSGRFFDFFMHHLIHGLIPAGLSWYSYRMTGNIFCLVLGFVAVAAMIFINLIQDIKCKVFVEKLISSEAGDIYSSEKTAGGAGALRPKPGYAKLIAAAYKLTEMHVMMNLLTAAAFCEIFFKPGPLRVYFFIFYLFLVPALVAAKCYHWIVNRKIDEEFLGLFKERQRGGS
jgi:phosphatidylglycerophosphate synthase